MIGIIAIKEFRNNIATPAFMVGLLLCLALIPYTVYTGIKTYETRLAQYEADVKAADDMYRLAPAYVSVTPILVKPVSPLGIFSKGIAEQTGSKVQIDRKEKPVFSNDIVALNENTFMGGFSSLDFATAIAILLSLVGILFSYDMLSREKEDGTLKLSLSNPVSRSSFFLGKIAGIFLTLLPILALCFLAILLVLQFSPSVDFTADDYGRIGMLMLAAMVYFAFFVFMGGFISSRTKSSTASIILNLFIWCFLLFLLPNAASWLGKNTTPAREYKQLQQEIAVVDKEWLDVQSNEVEKILEDEGLISRGWNYCLGADQDGANLIYFTPRPNMERERRMKELANPIILDNCAKKWAIQSDYLQEIYRQEKTVRYLTALSPAGILRQLSASFCRTGMDSEVHFMNQARQFQDVFFGYYVQNRIFSSFEYFTGQKESDFPNTWDEAIAQSTRFNEEHPEVKSLFDYRLAVGTVDTSGLPRFVYAPPTLGSDVLEQLYLIAGLLIACILLFWFSYVSFIKYDVR
ncbi:MAG: ABC transporter permease subunit [Tannerellaceae bacterium]|jgi:ABC-type transport system involved in multi-copper enzyme maturation permease subunit|nr:ABC transporter permease subunit [Tannerellaceae bacterium]